MGRAAQAEGGTGPVEVARIPGAARSLDLILAVARLKGEALRPAFEEEFPALP